jgi:membrane-associated protease RseP (regulator of RpoE activity)
MASPLHPFPAQPPGAFQPRPPMRAPRPKLWLHVLLFVATIGTTWYAWYFQSTGGRFNLPPALFRSSALLAAQYSFWVLLILTAHEFGHYFAAKRHRVLATLPFFIPLPLPPLGTMGAVIRMSPYIPNRRALFDIAVAGPLAGMAVALPVVFWGIKDATRVPIAAAQGVLHFGDPLMFRIAERLLIGPRPENYELIIGPMAFAGWVGLFVTALNLLPMSQLDGGHISYAVFGRLSRKIAMAVFATLALAMLFTGPTYILFLGLAWFVGIGHPPTMDDSEPLDSRRRAIAVLALVIFILSFTPTPIFQDG